MTVEHSLNLPPIEGLLQRAEEFLKKGELNYLVQSARLLAECASRCTEAQAPLIQRINADFVVLATAYKDYPKKLRKDSHDMRELSTDAVAQEILRCVTAVRAREVGAFGAVRFSYEPLIKSLLLYTNPEFSTTVGIPVLSGVREVLPTLPRDRALAVIQEIAVHQPESEPFEVENSARALGLVNDLDLQNLQPGETAQLATIEQLWAQRQEEFFKYASRTSSSVDVRMVNDYITYINRTGQRDKAHLDGLMALYQRTQQAAIPAREALTVFPAEEVFASVARQLDGLLQIPNFEQRRKNLRDFDMKRISAALTAVLAKLKKTGDSQDIIFSSLQAASFNGLISLLSNNAAEFAFAGQNQRMLSVFRDEWRSLFPSVSVLTADFIQVLERKKLDPPDAERIVKASLSEVSGDTEAIDHSKVACVDGRYGYLPGEIQPYAVPGGSVGFMMAIFGGFTDYLNGVKVPVRFFTDSMREVLWKKVVELMGGEMQFASHSDLHAEQDGAACPGCGHMMRALNDPEAYGLGKDDMDFIVKKVRELHQKAKSAMARTPEVLTGKHAEQAVVVVRGSKHNLNPVCRQDGFGETQVFRYTPDVADKYLQQLVAGLEGTALDLALPIIPAGDDQFATDLLSYFHSRCLEVFGVQLGATLGLLANGLPIYEVTVVDGKPVVRFDKQVVRKAPQTHVRE